MTSLRGVTRSARSLLSMVRGGMASGASTTPEFVLSLSQEERDIIQACQPYTLCSPERLIATVDAVEHVVRNNIRGALVECGVWRGGSVLAMLLTLQRQAIDDREVHLFDTFEGMTAPTVLDTSRFGGSAITAWRDAEAAGGRAWSSVFGSDVFGYQQVRDLLQSTGYPSDRLHTAVGEVERTLPDAAPDRIALLRLDTDWYESTLHELAHLYPRLEPGGVLLIDDYGHWDGARRAVDEYFAQVDRRPLLARTDYTGRLAIKPG